MEPAIRNGTHVNCGKDADEIEFCIKLLNRYFKDDYYNLAKNSIFPKMYSGHLERQDIGYLFSFMGKHILKWWD